MSKIKNWEHERKIRWRKIIDFLREADRSATVREIQEAVRAKSTSTIHRDLEALEKDGWIRCARPRGRRNTATGRAYRPQASWELNTDVHSLEKVGRRDMVRLWGTIGAGKRIPESHQSDHWVHTHLPPEACSDLCALRVEGDSMRDAGVFDGDIVILQTKDAASAVRSGNMAAVFIPAEDHLTLKYVYFAENTVRLVPANPDYQEIVYDRAEVEIQGKVVDILRQLDRLP